MVNPTASSSPFSSDKSAVESVGSSWRQTGHELRIESQGRMQSEWYMCLHGISLASEPITKASLHTAQCEQCESAIKWPATISTVGIDSTADFDAGGCS
jgi:hypothetical protein